MGQKVSPTGFRLGITEDWRSRWYAGKDYAKTLENDIAIRKFLDKQLARASVSRVDIERAGDKIKVTITTARPGVVIGKKGAEIDALRKKLEKVADGPVSIDVVEVKRPELDAELIAQSVAEQLEGRVAFRRAMRKAVQSAMKSGAKGIRIQCSGRLGRRRDEPPRVVPRGSRAAAHPPREDRLRLRHRRHHHGLHRRTGVGVPRRGAAGPEGSPARARGFVPPEPFPS